MEIKQQVVAKSTLSRATMAAGDTSLPKQQPPTPLTLTNESALPHQPRPPKDQAPELDDSIVARPLSLPNFTNVKPSNPGISLRWIFTGGGGLRFAQAKSQGYVVATKSDVVDGDKSPFLIEGGTKLVNGDLVLMKMDRRQYLGAKKARFQTSAALADHAMLRSYTKARANADLANTQGRMTAFTPSPADLEGTPLADAASELARLGGEVDIGK